MFNNVVMLFKTFASSQLVVVKMSCAEDLLENFIRAYSLGAIQKVLIAR